MGTLLCFHAHPDDESITTGGSMAKAHAEGHRVVLVVATDGDLGDRPDDLGAGETLGARRRAETLDSAEVLGVDRVEFLGYADSGLTGWAENEAVNAFVGADLDRAAVRLAEILRDERVDVLTTYDSHGGYGHPDHIMVHRVGARAAELVRADLPGLLVAEATMNRDAMRAMMTIAEEMGIAGPGPRDEERFDPDAPMDDGNPMGTPEAEITLGVDVSAYVGDKRRSMAAHASQIGADSFFLRMPEDAFALAFGTEWFIEHGRHPGPRQGWLFDS